MKLSGDRAARFVRRPDPQVVAALIHGPDPGQVAIHRRELVAAVTEGDPMRLTRMDPDAVRRDAAELADTLRARAFFPGRRAVLVEGVTGALADPLAMAMEGLLPEDAMLIATGTGLAAKSALVKLFEGAGDRAVLAFYPDSRPDPAALLAEAGCAASPTPEAEAALAELAEALDAGSFRQFCATLALYAADAGRLEAADIAALAPARPGAGDALVAAVTGGQADRVVPLVARLSAAGTAPQAMLSAVMRQMRLLHRLLCDPGGPRRAVEGLRPPVHGPRRDRLIAEAGRWQPARAERAIRILHEAERALRSSGPRPERAIAERGLLRVAMLAGR